MANVTGTLKEVGKLQERYRILAKLGSGGMADVFLGVQLGEESFQRLVVIKRVHALWLENQNAMKMFIAEARTIAQLNHPHIVQIYDLSRLGKDVCITMEYINGENLDYVRKAVLKAKKSIPLPIVCKMMVEACEALNYAHLAKTPDGQPFNLVHRDVGPHNLMLNTSGYLKVIDFGIAKSNARSDLTTPGMIKGKFSYLAPDLFKFDEIDGRIDLYALGLVFYELVTLRRCYEFKKDVTVAEVLKRVTTEEIIPPSSLVPHASKRLDALIGRAVHKDRDKRFQTGEELAAEIRAFAERGEGLASSSDVENWFAAQFSDRMAKRREFEQKALEKAQAMSERDDGQDVSDSQPGLSTTGTIQTANLSNITGASQFAIQAQTPSQIAPVKKTNPYVFILVFFILFAGAAVLVHQLFFKGDQAGDSRTGAATGSDNLLVKSDVPGAEVRIDGKAVGLTSADGLRLRIEPERMHLIEVSKAGHEPFALELKGVDGVVQTLQAPLPVSRKDGGVGDAGRQDLVASAKDPGAGDPPRRGDAAREDHGRRPAGGRKVAHVRRPADGKRHPQPKDAPAGDGPKDEGPGIEVEPPDDAPAVRPAPDPVDKPVEKPVVDPKPAKDPKPAVQVPEIYIPPVPDPATVASLQADDKKNYLSGDGNWSGAQVASQGCGSCHNGAKAKALDWNSKSKRLWKKFFQRRWHKKNGKLEDLFSKAELKRVSTYILGQVKEDKQTGIAGVK